MEIDLVDFSSEVASQLMWDKYGYSWNDTNDPELDAKRQTEYDHIYESIFLSLSWSFPTIKYIC